MTRQVLISFFALSLAIVSCTQKPKPTEEATEQGILLIGNGEEPNSLDPHIASSVAEAHVLYSLFEGLVSPHPDDPNRIAPGVASDWEYDSESNRYIFNLRSDALWSDGSPVTAYDFQRSVQRALGSKFGTSYPEMFFDLKNAEAYFQNKISNFELVGINATSDHTVEIELEKPSPHFLQKLKHFSWLPVPIDSIQKSGDWKSRSTRWATQETIVSNGPFMLQNWSRNSVIEVSKNNLYWDSENVSLNGIRFFPYENAQVEYRAFQSGQLHVTDKIPTEELGQMTSDSSKQQSDSFLATSYLILNTASEKLHNHSLREALARAIDKESLVNDINQSGKPAYSFTPPGLANYKLPSSYKYNPEKARQLIREAFPNPDDIPQLSILVSNIPASKAIGETLQAMWTETLGLEIELRNMEAKTLFSSLNSGDFDISYLTWSGDYEDPIAFLDLWKSQNAKNRARWSSPEFDKLLDVAETGLESRMDLLSEAETILLNESPIIPLIWKTKDYCIDEQVSNWMPALLDMRNYKHIRLVPSP
ncbi:MAG: oligopeptide transport system substrate-binding protein [Candidatus Pelagisphaera sp.]|jgi:oligopeptide transport system substrate-binding protein